MHRLVAASTLALLLASSLPGLEPVRTAAADSIGPLDPLPAGWESTHAASLGDTAYILGGYNLGPKDRILAFDFETERASFLEPRLPGARNWNAVAAADGAVYSFGGSSGGAAGYLTQVVRFDPATGTVEALDARLPSARAYPTAATLDGMIYIVGGSRESDGVWLDDILRFDPATEELTHVATLPGPRDLTVTLAWEGGLYVLGGRVGQSAITDEIVRYDPATGEVDVVGHLPFARVAGTGVALPQGLLYIGGFDAAWDDALDTLVSFDPAAGTVATKATRLLTPTANAMSATDGARVFVLGGVDRNTMGFSAPLSGVMLYDPLAPPPPTAVQAVPGPALGDVTLAWTASPHAAEDDVTHHRILRRTATGPEQAVADLPVTQSSYVDQGLQVGTTYYYRIKAVAPDAVGPPSVTACARAAPAHLLPSLDAPCAPPAGWRERLLLHQQVALPSARGNLLRVEAGADATDDRYYRIEAMVAGRTLPTVRLYDAGTSPPPLSQDLSVPETADAVVVRVAYRYDPAQVTCLVFVGTSCVARSPITPGVGAVDPGASAAVLLLEVRFLHEDTEVGRHHLQVPFAGQAGALVG